LASQELASNNDIPITLWQAVRFFDLGGKYAHRFCAWSQ